MLLFQLSSTNIGPIAFESEVTLETRRGAQMAIASPFTLAQSTQESMCCEGLNAKTYCVTPIFDECAISTTNKSKYAFLSFPFWT